MITEKIILGENTQYPLKGLLTLPSNAANPVPAVVFVHGSGSSNMDEKVGKLTPFKDLAVGLANHGIASIRYDKRSFTHGRKMVRNKNTVITVKEETIDDAILAAELLRKDPRIDPNHTFILGHSMGAMLAPRIDAEGGNFKGLILMAGSPRELEDIMIEQLEEHVQSGKGFMRWIAKKQLSKIMPMFDGLYQRSNDEAKIIKIGNSVTLYYFKEMGEHDNSDYLASLNKPILIMQGENDAQVKVDKDFSAYQMLLKNKTNVTFRLYENLNHAFVPSIYRDISKIMKEYSIEQHIGEEVISDIANWIMDISN